MGSAFGLLQSLIEIQPHIVRGAAAGDDVGPAIAVQVVHDQVFRGDAAVIDDVFGPFAARLVVGVVDKDSRAGRVARAFVAVPDHYLVGAVVVHVGDPYSVAALERVVQN